MLRHCYATVFEIQMCIKIRFLLYTYYMHNVFVHFDSLSGSHTDTV